MEYETSLARVLAALIIGALVGALIILSIDLMDAYKKSWKYDFIWYLRKNGPFVFSVSYVFFLVSLVIFGGPVWYLLHKLDRRQFYIALLAGAIVPVVVFVSFIQICYVSMDRCPIPPYFNYFAMIIYSIFIAASGAVIGLTIWRVAYRKSG